MKAVETVHQALHTAMEHFGHEVDDVGSPLIAFTPEAKRVESAFDALDRLSDVAHAAQQLVDEKRRYDIAMQSPLRGHEGEERRRVMDESINKRPAMYAVLEAALRSCRR